MLHGHGLAERTKRLLRMPVLRASQAKNSVNAAYAADGYAIPAARAARHPAQPRVFADRVADRERIVAGDAEDVANADVVQAGQHVLDDGQGHFVLRFAKAWKP